MVKLKKLLQILAIIPLYACVGGDGRIEVNFRAKATPIALTVSATPTATVSATPTASATATAAPTATATASSGCNTSGSPFGGGSGTTLDPYQICSYTQLTQVENNLSSNFILKANLDLNGQTFTPISNFTGIFDGDSKTISNFTYNDSTTTNAGFFAQMSGTAQVKNLTFTNAAVTAKANMGIVVGYNQSTNTSSLSNITVSGTVTSNGTFGTNPIENKYIGGIAGASTGGMTNLTSSATINVNNYTAYVGGIVGMMGSNTLTNCVSTANITVTSIGANNNYTGGLPQAFGYAGVVGGMSKASVSACSFRTGGSLTVNSSFAGGVAGIFGLMVNTDNVVVNYDISNNYNQVNISVSDQTVDVAGIGGAINLQNGTKNLTVDNVYNTGNITTGSNSGSYETNTGGLFGLIATVLGSNTTITNSYSTSTISVGNRPTYVGGLIGYAISQGSGSITIEDSYVTGSVTVGEDALYAGGFVGYYYGSTATINKSYTTANFTAGNQNAASASRLGGFAGSCKNCSITNSYAANTVSIGTNADTVGGFIGKSESATLINKNFHVGTYTVGAGTVNSDGFASGTTMGTITNAYSLNATTVGTQRTSGEFSDNTNTATNFPAFDFTTIWEHTGGSYPTLR